jgi:hypothetical protein
LICLLPREEYNEAIATVVTDNPQNFSEFWDFYVHEHSVPLNRALHFVGSLLSLAILFSLMWFGYWYYFPLAFVQGYAWAWAGHFLVEKNRPATFRFPLWSFAADWVMVWYMLQGKMSAEVQRINT